MHWSKQALASGVLTKRTLGPRTVCCVLLCLAQPTCGMLCFQLLLGCLLVQQNGNVDVAIRLDVAHLQHSTVTVGAILISQLACFTSEKRFC